MELFIVLTCTLIFIGNIHSSSGQNFLGELLGVDDNNPNPNLQQNKEENKGLLSELISGEETEDLRNRNPYNQKLISNPTNPYNQRLNSYLQSQRLLNWQNNFGMHPVVSQKINQGNYDDADVKLAAQKFPQLQSLLDRLKELNRQKELKNQGIVTPTEPTTDKTPTVPVTEDNKDTKGKFHKLKKKKFYFQAQPVVPENERKSLGEVVYYEME